MHTYTRAALGDHDSALLVVQMTWLVKMKALSIEIRNVLRKLKEINSLALSTKVQVS